MFVAIEADAVAQAVREKFVVWAEAAGGNHGTGCIIYCAREFAAACGVESGILRSADNVVNLAHFFRWLAKYTSARNVRIVAFQFAAAINQYDVTFLERLRFDAAVRESGRWAKENERLAPQSHLGIAHFDKLAYFGLGHTYAQGSEDGAENIASGFAGEAHQFEFVRGFHAATANRYGVAGSELKRRGCGAYVIE